MSRALSALLLTADIVGFLLCIGVAVDVITQHPYDWIGTGSTQGFRIFLIFAPLVALPVAPVYLVPGIFYLRKVRPHLVLNERVASGQGWPARPRKPILGLNWAWRELRISQRVKTVLSAGGAFLLGAAILQAPRTQGSPQQWFVHAGLIFLWPVFFFAIYLGLGFAQILLKLNMSVSFPEEDYSFPAARMQVLMQKEYSRRVNEFHRNRYPRGS